MPRPSRSRMNSAGEPALGAYTAAVAVCETATPAKATAAAAVSTATFLTAE